MSPSSIPELNADHLGLLEFQRRVRGLEGRHCNKPQLHHRRPPWGPRVPCTGPLAPRKSRLYPCRPSPGRGYPGIPSLDVMANVIPYIKGEEDKVETEARKILGRLDGRPHP